MKKFKAISSVVLGFTMCFSLALFTACEVTKDNTGNNNNPGGNGNVNNQQPGGNGNEGGGTLPTQLELVEAMGTTATEIVTSGKAFEIAMNADVAGPVYLEEIGGALIGSTRTIGEAVLSVQIDMQTQTITADATIEWNSTSTVNEEYSATIPNDSEYGFAAMYIRGEDVYGTEYDGDVALTEAQKANLEYRKSTIYDMLDMPAPVENYEQPAVIMGIISTFLQENAQQLMETGKKLGVNLINLLKSTITQTDNGYQMTIDVKEQLTALLNTVEGTMNAIGAQTTTIGAAFQTQAVKNIIDTLFASVTGEDVKALAVKLVEALSETELGAPPFTLPDAEGKTVYEYILAVLAMNMGEGMTLGEMPLDGEQLQAVAGYINQAKSILNDTLQKYTVEFEFGTNKFMTGVGFELDLEDIAADCSITLKETQATFVDVTSLNIRQSGVVA